MSTISLEALRIDPTDPNLKPAKGSTGRGGRARATAKFVMVPLGWLTRLEAAHGQTYRLALVLLFLHWKDSGRPVTLANCTVEAYGIPPQTKRRSLRDLEHRGLVEVDWRKKKSPIVRVLVD